jgi:16S rRNA (cytosine1402-N4)-methyltransferase
MQARHLPVLRDAVVELVAQGPGRVVLDATVGLGGHAEAILTRLPQARLVGLDVDPQALALAAERLRPFGARVVLRHGSYAALDEHLRDLGITAVDAVLLDLGVSSLQIDAAERGFSYRAEGPLDMRMDPGATQSAAELLNTADEREIARILREFGEEPLARRIARAIVERRRRAPLVTTADLAGVVERMVSGRKRVSSLARVFQGVRVAVNRELENLENGLQRALGVLAPGASFAVLAYHSLEDRAVKQHFRKQVEGCTCPPGLPQCACGFVAGFRLLTRRAIRPSAAEVAANPRARSVRLRALQRLAA